VLVLNERIVKARALARLAKIAETAEYSELSEWSEKRGSEPTVSEAVRGYLKAAGDPPPDLKKEKSEDLLRTILTGAAIGSPAGALYTYLTPGSGKSLGRYLQNMLLGGGLGVGGNLLANLEHLSSSSPKSTFDMEAAARRAGITREAVRDYYKLPPRMRTILDLPHDLSSGSYWDAVTDLPFVSGPVNTYRLARILQHPSERTAVGQVMQAVADANNMPLKEVYTRLNAVPDSELAENLYGEDSLRHSREEVKKLMLGALRDSINKKESYPRGSVPISFAKEVGKTLASVPSRSLRGAKKVVNTAALPLRATTFPMRSLIKALVSLSRPSESGVD